MRPIATSFTTGCLALGLLAGACHIAVAAGRTDDYQRGLADGYAGHFQNGQTPEPDTPYGRGFQEGQEQADEEDQAQQRQSDPFEPSIAQMGQQKPDTDTDK